MIPALITRTDIIDMLGTAMAMDMDIEELKLNLKTRTIIAESSIMGMMNELVDSIMALFIPFLKRSVVTSMSM